ncbi:LLM class flavin-dependent oxidoreductase [Amycolatopsis sp. NPDC051373]|uniref:LLM class flavin-dependent oxidoreductase n=1 Tax=Amycolatopsis sp. NPDC051373 TaxID=3155801 RepID=UPI00344B4BBA
MHDLLFGTFLTPDAHHPEHVVDLAIETERAGLDLVTVQDHPYNAGYLDTQTLLTWLAARTTKLRVAANVTNLPLRPPQVLAKAAASLDLLSGGRFELGLGAGAFADAAFRMTGERRTTGESIEALTEAIDILRGIWDTDTSGPLRHDGKHYQVPGLNRGPRPAHDIGIWLGAYQPRMLALTGRAADGWLPTYEYLRNPGLTEAIKRIDHAAAEAGRDPAAVRRLLNVMNVGFSPTRQGFLQGPPEQWVDELLPLILDVGITGFLFGGDDPRVMRILGEEVAPAVREAVEKERSGVRSAAALAQRHHGVDYDALPSSLAGKAVEPGDSAYQQVRHTYVRTGSPSLVVRARSTQDVVDTLAFARKQNLTLAVRSGGHGISGRSTLDRGVVLDLGRMNSVEVLDRAKRLVRLEPGARWGDVAQVLAREGLAMSSGDYGDVGVGGLATAGGLGYLARKYGLTIDHVVAAELVVADGRVLRVDAAHYPDLFWAIRGAGGNFGVVTAFELEADEVDNVAFANLTVDATDTAGLLEAWATTVESAPRELSSFLALLPGRRRSAPTAQITLIYANDDVEAAQEVFSRFLDVGPVLAQQAQLVPYSAIMVAHHGPHHGQGLSDTRSGLLTHVTPPVANAVADLVASGDILMVQFRSAGGAVNDQPADAMAYSHRTQNFSVLATTAPALRERMDRRWDGFRPYLDGMYLSFETDTRPERLLDAFPEPVLTKLRALKAEWDPDGVFNRNFPIS